jgi:hypothetical protein
VREPTASAAANVSLWLSLLAVGWGLGLSVAAFHVGLLVADATHLPAARAYFGSDVSISDAEIAEATFNAVLAVLGYVSAWIFGLWMIARQPAFARGWLRGCLGISASPGALLGLVIIFIGTFFVKGVA